MHGNALQLTHWVGELTILWCTKGGDQRQNVIRGTVMLHQWSLRIEDEHECTMLQADVHTAAFFRFKEEQQRRFKMSLPNS